MTLQVFISWSGEPSREVAESLSSFSRHVVREVDTFVSARDIPIGERWEARLMEEIERADLAILCVTRQNQSSPWLNYEAGMLGRALGASRVIPYTIDLRPSELVGPIARLQGVQNDVEGTWVLVRTLNAALAKPGDTAFVREAFELWWPRLQEKMAGATRPAVDAPTDRELLLEIRRDVQRFGELLRTQPLDPPTAGGSPPAPSRVASRQPPPPAALSRAPNAPALAVLAELDPLTGLANRRALRELGARLSEAGVAYVLAILDMDRFKQINDQLGHEKGDEALQLVGRVMREHLAADLVARVGGDEFGALFVGVDAATAVERVHGLVAHLSSTLAEEGFPALTASWGVSRSEPADLEEKLTAADQAMYEAKRAGRARGVASS